MIPKRGRRVVYLAGAILAVVLVALLFSSGQLVTQYHVLLLQHNESYLEELLRGDPHELQRAAIEKYLQGVDGRGRIVKLFLDAIEEKTHDRRTQLDAKPMGQPLVSGVLVVGNSVVCGFQYGNAGGSTTDALRDGEDDRLIRAIVPYLRSLSTQTFTLDEHPGTEISLLPGDQVCADVGVYCHFMDGSITKIGRKRDRVRPDWVTDDDIKKLATGVGLVLRRVEGDMAE